MGKIACLILVLLCCCDNENINKKCMAVIISNSIPVQFWINGEESFNDKSVCGIEPVCFCQPFQCDDEIKIQLKDDDVGSGYALLITGAGADVVIPFDYSNSVSFVPADYGICDNEIHFSVNTTSGLIVLADVINEYNPFITIDYSFGSVPWTISPSDFSVLFGSDPFPGTLSNIAKITFVGGGEYITITHEIQVTATAGVRNYNMEYSFYNAGVLVGSVSKNYIVPDSTSISTTDTLSLSVGVFTEIRLIVTHPEQSFSEFSIINMIISSLFEEVASSDCISVKTNQPCTKLITYSNNTSFDDIVDQSPNTTFNLRIPAIFFQQNNPTEREDIELSDGNIVRTYTKIEEKKLLELGFMPAYMHRKIILALSHDNVIIDGKSWLMRDAYEKAEGNRHYPLNTAKVLLADKNFIKENQL